MTTLDQDHDEIMPLVNVTAEVLDLSQAVTLADEGGSCACTISGPSGPTLEDAICDLHANIARAFGASVALKLLLRARSIS
jgi:hypothetical protein